MSVLASVDVEQLGELCVVHVVGEVDISNARDLSAQVEEAIPNDASKVAIDLSATTYLDSAGVQLLFVLAERLSTRRHDVSVVVPEDSPIRAVLEVTTLPRVVRLQSRLDEGA